MTRFVAVVVLVLAFAAIAAGSSPVVPHGGVLVGPEGLADDSRARVAADRVLSSLMDGDADTAIALSAAEADPLRFEQMATVVVDALRQADPSVAGTHWLEWLEVQPVRVWQRHEETSADWFVPVYQLDRRASGTLQLWQRRLLADAWRERFARDPVPAVQALAAVDDAQRQAAADAVGALDRASLDRLRSALLQHDEAPAGLWLAVAERRPDRQAFIEIFTRGTQRDRLAALQRVTVLLAAADAHTVLLQAAEDRDLASAATLALAELAGRHPPAFELLQQRLEQRELGASAAAALARMPVDDRVPRIEKLLGEHPSPTRAAHLVLALRLEGSSAAQSVLQRWADDPRLPEPMRKELQR